jgi:DNA-binding winged helix-turn-helix (wHTH) protein
MQYRFGPFVSDSNFRRVNRVDDPQFSLSGKKAELLLYLIEHRHGVVTRQELLEALWKAHTTPASLDTTIARLRNALGDAASRPQYIQNQWGEGYRFIAEIEELDPARSQKNFAAADGPLPAPAGKNMIRKSRRLAFLLAAACCILLAGIVGWLIGH